MSYVPLYKYLPDLAEKEIRHITVMKDDHGVPKGEYGLLELYCDDLNCDCRRVFIEVVSRELKTSVAVIAYGWETEKFYAKWYGITKEDKEYSSVIRDLRGPILNAASRQSVFAPAILEIINDLAFKDVEYVNRLKIHYKLFKEISNKEKRNNENNLKIETGRNEPCICGSGKKYKRCCLNNERGEI